MFVLFSMFWFAGYNVLQLLLLTPLLVLGVVLISIKTSGKDQFTYENNSTMETVDMTTTLASPLETTTRSAYVVNNRISTDQDIQHIGLLTSSKNSKCAFVCDYWRSNSCSISS